MKPIVLCLSGGLDSTVTGALLRRSHRVLPIYFDYGQPAAGEELRAALAVSSRLALASLEVAKMPCWTHTPGEVTLSPFFVPHRNLMMGALALNYAAHVKAETVAFGFVADTNPHLFPDATKLFAERLNSALCADTLRGKSSPIAAPVARFYKRDLILAALENDVPLELTYSCYEARRCSRCPACVAVTTAFAEAEGSIDVDRRGLLERRNPYRSFPTVVSSPR